MEFTAKLENFNTKLWTWHIKVPNPIAKYFLDQGDKRVICMLNETAAVQCAIMPAGDGVFFININKKLRDQLKLKEGSKVNVTLEKDKSEYGLPFPEELKELLDQDAAGNKWFHALPPGKQRNIIYYVGQMKNPDLRIHRGMVFLEHLKRNKGKLNFREILDDFQKKT
ncbi:MAG: DUF1905 domain-containing protein [Saprospiraceae bacterium]|uniref:DUF1905 domain-containing protein n=1 Tax=Candidatus Opimibacter skivensis TaxID=2982028 RepID=A0A9D7XM72_9BACT|nr:DUF1905 domain-containing protein [Candidatus Opimibacter skivensis]